MGHMFLGNNIGGASAFTALWYKKSGDLHGEQPYIRTG